LAIAKESLEIPRCHEVPRIFINGTQTGYPQFLNSYRRREREGRGGVYISLFIIELNSPILFEDKTNEVIFPKRQIEEYFRRITIPINPRQ